ncbi:MAG TPA: hypothetical protein GXZ95_02365 [Mollicutes bacterium]|nr:hypothetical protein [Mollicutes bacterium]
MYGRGRPFFRPSRRFGFGFGRQNFFVPFTLGALTGAALTPPFRPFYPYAYYPYPYFY